MKIKRSESSFKVQFGFLGHDIVFYIGRKPLVATVGVTNETSDNYFVPFIDYDDIYYDVVKNDVKHIQSVFDLGTMVVLKNKEQKDEEGRVFGNYLVIGFDKLTFQEHLEMLKHTRCDRNYLLVPRFYRGRNWVIRISGKYLLTNKGVKELKSEPKFKEMFYRKSKREGYRAMKLFVEKFFKVPNVKGYRWDESSEVEFIQYRTTDKRSLVDYIGSLKGWLNG